MLRLSWAVTISGINNVIGLTMQLDQPTDLISSFEKIVFKEKTVTKKSWMHNAPVNKQKLVYDILFYYDITNMLDIVSSANSTSTSKLNSNKLQGKENQVMIIHRCSNSCFS